MTFDEVAPFLSSRLLHLILMPTEQCNFRCVYCFEDFSAGEMSRQVIGGVKALLTRRVAGLDLLSLSWFGGEPLLAWPIVEEIQGFAAELTRVHPGVRFIGSMSTNGSLLTPDRFARLLALGLRSFQVSLDGSREAHDSTRRRRSGGGSFAAIWRNLLAMRPSTEAFDVLLRLHVTRDNQEAIGQLLGELARELGGDPRFAVVFKAIRRFGGPHDAQLPVLLPDEEAAVLGRLGARASELGFGNRQDVFARPGMLQGCYAAALGSYVVRSTGELGKCTVALDHPNNRIGKLLPDGTLDIDSPKMIGWLRGALNGDRESLRCPARVWAGGASGHEIPQRLVQIGTAS
ncbi:MAG TPA: radical SAM protein [Thermoanaerobaculia bacterium]|nr:radical SAM protein [Thermoanaerobaculia bacterium]